MTKINHLEKIKARIKINDIPIGTFFYGTVGGADLKDEGHLYAKHFSGIVDMDDMSNTWIGGTTVTDYVPVEVSIDVLRCLD